mgnify:CR=1 FL=1
MEFIAYYRVSEEQGLALNSLRNSVERHVTQEGGKLVREFIETVTDFGQVGEVFEAAVRQCRSNKATLILAESDPLSSQLGMLALLVRHTVPLAAAGHSDVNRLLAPLFTGTRSRADSTVAKANKALLRSADRGNPDLDGARAKSVEVRQKKADEFASKHCRDVIRMRTDGYTLAEIADLLNGVGRLGPRGGKWHSTSVSNLIERCKCLGDPKS